MFSWVPASTFDPRSHSARFYSYPTPRNNQLQMMKSVYLHLAAAPYRERRLRWSGPILTSRTSCRAMYTVSLPIRDGNLDFLLLKMRPTKPHQFCQSPSAKRVLNMKCSIINPRKSRNWQVDIYGRWLNMTVRWTQMSPVRVSHSLGADVSGCTRPPKRRR
jgi:hypothetical protein